MQKIGIIGAGVAGSYLHALLKSAGRESQLYDVTSRYFKACGEAVTNSYSPKIPWKVVAEVHEFSFFMDGKPIYSTSFRHPKWVIIDKNAWINSMREDAIVGQRPNSAEFDLMVDATGPYSKDREVVYAARALVQAEKAPDGVVMEFDSRLTGFYWIFPSANGMLNIGAGFMEVKDPLPLLRNYVKRIGGNITSILGAPITVGLVKATAKRIGEARGLVYPIAGEGIRPAALSAEIAADAILRGRELEESLSAGLRDVEREIRTQRRLLGLYRIAPAQLRRHVMKSVFSSDLFLEAYLSDRADAWDALSAFVKAH
ncbi:NAD(P)/FAD-dependent oxidoreductase [Tardisphaera miroshnichenkoae]